MENFSNEPSPAETLQVANLDYWARMEAVNESMMTSPNVPAHEQPPHFLLRELAGEPTEVKLVRLHDWAMENYQGLNQQYDATEDELDWRAGQSQLLEEYKSLLLGLAMLTVEDYKKFNERFADDYTFRARFEYASPDAMRSVSWPM